MEYMKSTSIFRFLVLLVLLCLPPLWMLAQNRVVKGVVKDALGDPVIGANVAEVGTTNGTITDLDGNFSLEVSPRGSISVSFIGYETQTISVAGKSIINVTLKEDTETLDEVVVVGLWYAEEKGFDGSHHFGEVGSPGCHGAYQHPGGIARKGCRCDGGGRRTERNAHDPYPR